MHFLDNDAKKRRSIRLAVYYIFIIFVVFIVTCLLVFQAKGYDIDRKTKSVIRNGIVYLSSNPSDAEVYINGKKDQTKTNTKLVIPEGEYNLELKKNGYFDWSKSMFVQGGVVHEISYPNLYPKVLNYTNLKGYGSTGPGMISQSKDFKWLIIQSNSNPLQFDLYDTTKPSNTPKTLILPTTLVTLTDGKPGKISPVNWSDDSKKIIIENKLVSSSEFIYLDRENVNNSINLTKSYPNISKFEFLADKADRLLGLSSTGVLQSLNIDNQSDSLKIADNVAKFISITESKTLVMTFLPNEPLKSDSILVVDGQKKYNFGYASQMLANYDLKAYVYDDNEFYFISDKSTSKVNVYFNPIEFLKDEQKAKNLQPINSIKITNSNFLPGSNDNRYQPVTNGQIMVVYDSKLRKSVRYENRQLSTGKNFHWVDNSHYSVATDDAVYITEYDGGNLFTVPGASQIGYVALDNEDKYLFTFRSEVLSQSQNLSYAKLEVKD